MQYNISYEPFYELEGIKILQNILNDKSIKTERDEIIKKRGNRYKSVVTQFFKNAIILENYIKKNIKLDMPGFESNGHQLAEFLFKEKESPEMLAAYMIFEYSCLLQKGIDNKEVAILKQLGDVIEKHYGKETLPEISTAHDFFSLLEECPISGEDKFDVIRLYHSFDMYLCYTQDLLAQIRALICQLWPDMTNTTAPLMDFLASKIATDSEAFLHDQFNITINTTLDNDIYVLYPGLYDVNSCRFWSTGYTNIVNAIFGMHVFDMAEAFKDADGSSEAFLKCLSDNTKLNILKLLKQGPMYGSQLAEKLNCTSANISHHASSLLSLGVIRMEKESNRLYLYLNKEKIHQYIEDLKALF